MPEAAKRSHGDDVLRAPAAADRAAADRAVPDRAAADREGGGT